MDMWHIVAITYLPSMITVQPTVNHTLHNCLWALSSMVTLTFDLMTFNGTIVRLLRRISCLSTVNYNNLHLWPFGLKTAWLVTVVPMYQIWIFCDFPFFELQVCTAQDRQSGKQTERSNARCSLQQEGVHKNKQHCTQFHQQKNQLTNHFTCRSYSLQNFISKYNGEEEFVFLKQRPTNVAVETVREMVRQITQSSVENLWFVAE